MLIEQSAPDVAARFGIEVFEIQRQINFLKSKSTVHVDEIDKHNDVLGNNEISELPTRDWLGVPPHHLTANEIEELVPEIDRATAAIDSVSSALNHRIDGIQLLWEEGALADRPELLAEWTEYLRTDFLRPDAGRDLQAARLPRAERRARARRRRGNYPEPRKPRLLTKASRGLFTQSCSIGCTNCTIFANALTKSRLSRNPGNPVPQWGRTAKDSLL